MLSSRQLHSGCLEMPKSWRTRPPDLAMRKAPAPPRAWLPGNRGAPSSIRRGLTSRPNVYAAGNAAAFMKRCADKERIWAGDLLAHIFYAGGSSQNTDGFLAYSSCGLKKGIPF